MTERAGHPLLGAWRDELVGYVNRIPDDQLPGHVVARCPVCRDPFARLGATCSGTYLHSHYDGIRGVDSRHQRTPVEPIRANALGLTPYGLRHRLLHEL